VGPTSFLNGYGTNRDWLGWHADDDSGIDHTYPIAGVTLYGDGPKNGLRAIQVGPMADKEKVETFM
jgi:hypothetical protein